MKRGIGKSIVATVLSAALLPWPCSASIGSASGGNSCVNTSFYEQALIPSAVVSPRGISWFLRRPHQYFQWLAAILAVVLPDPIVSPPQNLPQAGFVEIKN